MDIISKTYRSEHNIARLDEFLELVRLFRGKVPGEIINEFEELHTYVVGIVATQCVERTILGTAPTRIKNKFFSYDFSSLKNVKEAVEENLQSDIMFLPYFMIDTFNIESKYISYYTCIDSNTSDYTKLELLYSNNEYKYACIFALKKIISYFIFKIKSSSFSVDVRKFEGALNTYDMLNKLVNQLNSIALLISTNGSIVKRARVINMVHSFVYYKDINAHQLGSYSIDSYIDSNISYKEKQLIIDEMKNVFENSISN